MSAISGRPGAAVGCGICLFAIVAAVVTVVMLLAAPQTAAIMHAPVDAFSSTVAYTRICSAGAVFIVAYNILGSIFRGIGDSVMPLITVLIACICNIAGDLLLVGGLHMGAAGAAYATVAAQAISVALSLILIRRRKLPFTLERGDIRPDAALIRQILRLGSPVALQDLLVSLSFLAIIGIANSMGTVPSAGVGVAEKLCAFVMLVPSAYMQSMSAFVAQNIGAGAGAPRPPGRSGAAWRPPLRQVSSWAGSHFFTAIFWWACSLMTRRSLPPHGNI